MKGFLKKKQKNKIKDARQEPVLDLHGVDKDEILNLVDRFLRQHSNKEQVYIIVGKGKGLIHDKVIEYLKLAKYPWKYELIYGVANKGSLVIDLS